MIRPPQSASHCTSLIASSICCRKIRSRAPGRVPGTRELVIPKTPYIVPTACAAQKSRSPASITRRAAGPTACNLFVVTKGSASLPIDKLGFVEVVHITASYVLLAFSDDDLSANQPCTFRPVVGHL